MMGWIDFCKIVAAAIVGINGLDVIMRQFGQNGKSMTSSQDFLSIAISVIVSSGIVGVVLNIIFNKKLEDYKSRLEKKIYVSKARFDLEFCTLKEISVALFIAIESCYWLFPDRIDSLPQDEIEKRDLYKARYDTAQENTYTLQRLLGSRSPFIPEKLFNDFADIKKLLSIQVNMFKHYVLKENRYEFEPELVLNKKRQEGESLLRTDEIRKEHDRVICKLREHIYKKEEENL